MTVCSVGLAAVSTMPRRGVIPAAISPSLVGPSFFSRSAPLRCCSPPEPELVEPELVEPPEPPEPPLFSPSDMPGVSEPLGFFDPAGFSETTEGRLRFYREVELKHGRVAMLAALGFPIGEQFHPLFGGEIDVPSYVAFQETPLQAFWPLVIVPIAILEIYSVFSFNSPLMGGEVWSIRADFESGDLGFDPLGLRPESAEEFKELQTKELNNGRLAMIGIAGMVSQELATGNKLF